ncbi:DNA translocase FtsK [Pseudomonas rhodesiae]
MSWWKNLFCSGSIPETRAPTPAVIEMPPISDIDDRLYPEAVKLVLQSGNTSVSLVQRALKIGFGRADGFIQQMEVDLVIAPMNESGQRRVLRPDERELLRVLADQEAQRNSTDDSTNAKPRAALRLVSSRKD